METRNVKEMDSVEAQKSTFIALVKEVNAIPGVVISVSEEREDSQRDALAFIVDSIYLQFKENNWQLVLEQLPFKIHSWNTPPDAFKATSSLLEFIRHLFEFRMLDLLKEPDLSDENKAYIEALSQLYLASIESNLKNAKPGHPVFFGGISRSLLPEWYLEKYY